MPGPATKVAPGPVRTTGQVTGQRDMSLELNLGFRDSVDNNFKCTKQRGPGRVPNMFVPDKDCPGQRLPGHHIYETGESSKIILGHHTTESGHPRDIPGTSPDILRQKVIKHCPRVENRNADNGHIRIPDICLDKSTLYSK